MPHTNISGDNIISLQHAKIAQKSFTVLSEVNLNIKKGKFCYLIGKTGSGKSSLLKTLYGHIPLASGHGTVVGFDIAKLKSSDIPNLRRKLGIVFQDFQLLPDRTVEKNLKFVLEATGWSDKAKMEERINMVLASVNMKSKKHKMPHELSGGEQQRVAIKTAVPLWLICFNNNTISSDVSGSKFPVGSSAKIISGLLSKALAITTRCCSPPDISCGIFLILERKPTFSKTSLMRSLIRFLSSQPVAFKTNSKFCSTVLSLNN